MVFIAYNHDNYPISIVSTKSKELAMAYWAGNKTLPHIVRCLEDPDDFIPLDENPIGVSPIIRIEPIEVHTRGKFLAVLK